MLVTPWQAKCRTISVAGNARPGEALHAMLAHRGRGPASTTMEKIVEGPPGVTRADECVIEACFGR